MPRMTHSEKGTSSESAAFNKTRSEPVSLAEGGNQYIFTAFNAGR